MEADKTVVLSCHLSNLCFANQFRLVAIVYVEYTLQSDFKTPLVK